jgi:hypothetical protein
MSAAKTRDGRGRGRLDGGGVLLQKPVDGGDDLFADLKHPALDGFAKWRAVP